MSDSKTYLVINAIPNHADMESFQLYLSKIIPIFKEFGGTNFQRFKTSEQIMGKGGVKATAIVEFPNPAVIHQMKASEAFNALNELRAKAYQQEVDLMICEAI
jgi:uncharacterized protein (DUF1330 family)